jgi:hypothetical protein
MKYPNLDDWKKAATDAGYTLKQIQGFEQYEALKGTEVVGRFSGEGELPGTTKAAPHAGIPQKDPGIPVVVRQPGGNVAADEDPLAAIRRQVSGT